MTLSAQIHRGGDVWRITMRAEVDGQQVTRIVLSEDVTFPQHQIIGWYWPRVTKEGKRSYDLRRQWRAVVTEDNYPVVNINGYYNRNADQFWAVMKELWEKAGELP
jgi:hypothetical protein